MERPVLAKELRLAVEVLRRGGVIAFPTDTLYGLGASIRLPEAVMRVFEIKGRPPGMALPILISGLEQMSQLARDIPPVAWRIAKAFWPGPLTLVLPRSSAVPDIVVAGGDTVALRWPAHPVPVALVDALGSPITGTSANLSGRPPARTAAEVEEQLGNMVDLVIRGGPPASGLGSTVMEIAGGYIRVLRTGPVTLEDIERACGMTTAQIEATRIGSA